jgi:hypothetical protein
MIPSSAAPSSTLATIPNPRKSGSTDRSTTSSASRVGGESRKGRTGGLTGYPRASCENDPVTSSIEDEAKEVDEDIIEEQKTNKVENQGREKERSTVVVGKRDRKRSTDTSSSSSSIKTGSASGGGFVRDVVEDENKVSSSYRYVGSESRESDFTFFDLFLLIYRHPNRTAGSLPSSHPPILFALLIRLLSLNHLQIWLLYRPLRPSRAPHPGLLRITSIHHPRAPSRRSSPPSRTDMASRVCKLNNNRTKEGLVLGRSKAGWDCRCN